MLITALQNLKKHCAKLVFFNSLKILLIFLLSGQAPTAFAAPICTQNPVNRVCLDLSTTNLAAGEDITLTAWLLVPCSPGSNIRCFDPFAAFTFLMNSGTPISPKILVNPKTGRAIFTIKAGPIQPGTQNFSPLDVGFPVISARDTFLDQSVPIQITVRAKQSLTSLSSSATTIKYEEPITLSSFVSGYRLNGKLSFIKKLPPLEGQPDRFQTIFTNTYTSGVPAKSNSFVDSFATPGVNTYSAIFESTDETNISSQSQAITVTVLRTDVIHTLSTATTEPVEFGQPISLISNLAYRFFDLSGKVDFYDGDTFLGSETVLTENVVLTGSGRNIKVPFTTFNIKTLGNHLIRAEYSGDSLSNPASANFNLTIVAAKSLTTLSSSGSPSFGGKPITLSGVVSGVEPTGTVSFYDGTKLLGATQLLAGTAAIVTSEIKGIGNHAISAVYGGDERNRTSTSPNITQTIKLNPAILTPILNVLID